MTQLLKPGGRLQVFVLASVMAWSVRGRLTLPATEPTAAAVRDLGSRRELFVDRYLIDDLRGATRRLHHPQPQQVAIVHDEPWEGNVCYYHTVFEDEGRFRMYYRGMHSEPGGGSSTGPSHEVVCYAESRDGIHWQKPKLGLHPFRGSRANNIVWAGVGTHNFVPFRDAHPNCDPQARYKALGATHEGLYAFASPDALHWRLMQQAPVITQGRFDSQNLAFFDTTRGHYVEFQRGFQDGVRAIMTATSEDFLEWTEPEFVRFTDDHRIHLYTNQTTPYHRAPHLYLAFPKRLVPSRNPTRHRYSGVSDILFMSSRDGRTFERFTEAFLRPGRQPDRWVNRNNLLAWGILETATDRNGVARELSFYSIEGYYQGADCRMRRYTLRPDGFVSVGAPLSGGELTTPPLRFSLPATAVAPPYGQVSSPAIRVDCKRPVRGSGSLTFAAPAILRLGQTTNLGTQATLAVALRQVPAGVRRLFSTYNGGTTVPAELFFDINSGGPIGAGGAYSIRFDYNGVQIGAPWEAIGDWSRSTDPTTVHHIAATWDDGRVALYFDGRQVASGGSPGTGELRFAEGDLQFGEDFPPASQSNEPFLGTVDDLLILRRRLSPLEIAVLAEAACTGNGTLPSVTAGVLVSADDLTMPLADDLVTDGRQAVTVAGSAVPGEVELRVNFSTSAAGSIRCEIQNAVGQPLDGFTLDDSDELYGDALDQPMSWNGNCELKSLVGQPVRLRFVLRDADVYALRFGR